MEPAFHHEIVSESGGSAAESPLRWDEPIYIPLAVHQLPLRTFDLSFGALFFLNSHNFWVAGDLHGRRYRELRLLAWCDVKHLSEIHGWVAQLHQTHHVSPSAVRESFPPPPPPVAARPPRPVSRPPAVPRCLPSDTFAVPASARGIGIHSVPLSTRLRNILFRNGVNRLGELDGLPCRALLLLRDCGHKTIAELHQAIARAARGERLVQPRIFLVPQTIRALKIADLPFSARARNVLNKLEVICLGELDGRQCDHPHLQNCGRKTIEEFRRMIERAAAGEFAPPDAGHWEPAALIPLLDALVAQLPERKRLAVCFRLGAEDGVKMTLESVVRRIGMTRERVRQIMLSVGRLSALPLKAHLELLKKRCRRAALSPALLGQWLGDAPTRYSLPFYVRLIALLAPDIKVKGV